MPDCMSIINLLWKKSLILFSETPFFIRVCIGSVLRYPIYGLNIDHFLQFQFLFQLFPMYVLFHIEFLFAAFNAPIHYTFLIPPTIPQPKSCPFKVWHLSFSRILFGAVVVHSLCISSTDDGKCQQNRRRQLPVFGKHRVFVFDYM